MQQSAISHGNHAIRKRLTEQLKEYWLSLNGGKMPCENDFNISKLSDIWDSCFLIKIDDSLSNKHGYLYLGDELIEAYGDNFNEKEICEKLLFPTIDPIQPHVDKVLANKLPHEYDGEFCNANNLLVRYRAVLLPLSRENQSEVVFLVGGMRWKTYL
jgi:hypothetical protein